MVSLHKYGLPELRSRLRHVRRCIKEEQYKSRLIPREYILDQLEAEKYELENAIVERVDVKETK